MYATTEEISLIYIASFPDSHTPLSSYLVGIRVRKWAYIVPMGTVIARFSCLFVFLLKKKESEGLQHWYWLLSVRDHFGKLCK